MDLSHTGQVQKNGPQMKANGYFESYTIGAEGKIKINEASEDFFFDPNVTLWGQFFALALLLHPKNAFYGMPACILP